MRPRLQRLAASEGALQSEDGDYQRRAHKPLLRRVTRGYVYTLLLFTQALSVSLIIAVWGLGAFYLQLPVVQHHAPVWIMPAAVLVHSLSAALFLWHSCLRILRGTPRVYALLVAVGCCTSLVLFGTARALTGLPLADAFNALTWGAVVATAVCSVAAQRVLIRRVYTVKQPPLWPWEKRDKRVTETAQLQQIWDIS